MYNEGAPEFVADQGLYYPTTTNYGYYCTGFESPGEWDDQYRIFGLDGLDVQFPGAQTESLPYVYYTPNYGYADSPYNPYNPYLPGALVGADAPFVGSRQYYTVSPYQNSVSSPAYFPFVTNSRLDSVPNSSPGPFIDNGASTSARTFRPSVKENLSSSTSGILYTTPQRIASRPTHTLTNLLEDPRVNAGQSRQPLIYGAITPSTFPVPTSSHTIEARTASATIQADSAANTKGNQLKVVLPFGNGMPDFGSTAHGRTSVDKLWPKFQNGSALIDSENTDTVNDHNQGPITNRPKKLLAVKAYTTKVGDGNAQGNIIIYADQYNKDDFSVGYLDAKFFVIKSYSEDDVHKSIKYNVWSSTPNGNKKLNSAYEDAHRMEAGQSRHCPVFLFFSVNASGQFCGVAEMIGPVDFQKDMDFWQQDKWNGSFPVKWHFIKDVPNTNFRHIILENNENRPVTNSRDTQEIMYKQGLEMLKIFRNYTLKTSLLDDFLYYENRQKILLEEKARLLVKSYDTPFFVTTIDPPRKLNVPHSLEFEKINQLKKPNAVENTGVLAFEQVVSSTTRPLEIIKKDEHEGGGAAAEDDTVSSTLAAVSSLTINSKKGESKPVAAPCVGEPLGAETINVVTVGSIPVRVVNGFAKSMGLLHLDKGDVAKSGS